MTGIAGPTDLTAGKPRVRLEPIPLPETRRSGRARQRQRRQRQRRRRRLRTLAMVLLIAAVGAAAAVAATWLGSRNDERSPDRPAASTGTETKAGTPPVLLAQPDASGRASSLTVLAPGGSGGGTLVLIPPGTMTEIVSLGPEPVGHSLALGGPSRLRATVENLLGAGLAGAVVLDDAGLAKLLAPAGPLTVDVPERVEVVDDGGRVTVLYEAGLTRVTPAEAGRFLSARGRGNDLARLARHQAFWEAWLAALRQRPSAVPGEPKELSRAVRALAGGAVTTRVVPVEAFGTSGPDGELYRVQQEELGRLSASVFSTAGGRPGAGDRPRVQVLNGTGAVGLADAVRDKLGPGFDVRLSGNASTFDHARTQIVYYEPEGQAAAERVRKALGVGTLVLSRRPLDVVDVTVIVGKDFKPT